MLKKTGILSLMVTFLLALSGGLAQAVVIDTVTIGDPGNTADDTTWGAVDYTYNIGTYEVTNAQYTEFLNAVADADAYGLYNPAMGSTGALGSGPGAIGRTGSSGSYEYAVINSRGDKPVQYVSWGDAARFANWLHNGQGSGDTEDGAYFLDGITSNDDLVLVDRETDWLWAIPSEDEWYKAAYYDGSGYYDYPIGSDTMPLAGSPPGGTNSANFYGDPTWTIIGGLTDIGAYTNSDSPYGTFDQGGNVCEWNEWIQDFSDTPAYGFSWAAGVRGASFRQTEEYMEVNGRSIYTIGFAPDRAYEAEGLGFRVSQIPEPATVALLGLGALSLLRRKRSA